MKTQVLGTVLAAAIALGACGGSPEPQAKILDTERVERAIERSTIAQRGVSSRVTCPSGVHQEKGRDFSCTALFEDQRTRFAVTQMDDAGRVHYAAR